ncbi:MAG: DUF4351 domain-containing protein [Opitutaceae bacterium]|jgi:predicted transposase YdaD|nr:DUF4351 domain-containing protein [Opitutaceae bacterium]
MGNRKEITTDYDGAWKEALEIYLRPFLELCFPEVAAGIDWSQKPEFLDQDLQQLTRDSELGLQRVDKLVKVKRKDGIEEVILVHTEVEGDPREGMPLRMYQYHHRIADRFGRRTVSLAILADTRKDWKPSVYEEELWGMRVRFEYPVCKLIEISRERLEQEIQARNPAAVIIQAHLAAQASRTDMTTRRETKWHLIRRLYELNYSKRDILELFRLIDWLITLPREMELAFRENLVNYEKEKTMPYITSIERLGREDGLKEGLEKGWQKGRQEGWQEGRQEGEMLVLRRQLRRRFEDLPGWAEERLTHASTTELEEWSERILDAVILEDVFSS